MKEMSSHHNHNPIEGFKDDLFNRKQFVNATASHILYRSKNNGVSCATIGIYGKWGEGKTSILNMVKEQIEKESVPKDMRIIDFNPWFFKDQKSLLLDFFSVLQKGVSSTKVKDKIKRYAPFVSMGASFLTNLVAPGVGRIVDQSINKISNTIVNTEYTIQELKDEVNESIKLSGQHIAIFIDDVDRLDRDELHTLFKLIKQTADFVNTTYIIAMDVEMVAKSIGNRFEDGSQIAGKNFIEKIVQYPFYLPKIQSGDLYRLLLKQFGKVYLELTNSNEEKDYTIAERIVNNILPLFETARQIYLYINSFEFNFRFIVNEVNVFDFAYLEAIKMFHYKGYELIMNNRQLVTGFRLYSPDNVKNEDTRIGDVNFIKDVYKNAPKRINKYIENLATNILYHLKHPNMSYDAMVYHRKIGSDKHFDKYFTYSISEGILSDFQIETFSSQLRDENIDSLTLLFNKIIKGHSLSELNRVLNTIFFHSNNDPLSIEIITKSCIAFSHLEINKVDAQYRIENNAIQVIEYIIGIIDSDIFFQNESNDYKHQINVLYQILNTEPTTLFKLYLATLFVVNSRLFLKNKKPILKLIGNYYIKLADEIEELNSDILIKSTPEVLITTLTSVKLIDNKWFDEVFTEQIFSKSFNLYDFIDRLFYSQDSVKFYEDFTSLFDVDRIFKELIALNKESDDEMANKASYFFRLYHTNKR